MSIPPIRRDIYSAHLTDQERELDRLFALASTVQSFRRLQPIRWATEGPEETGTESSSAASTDARHETDADDD